MEKYESLMKEASDRFNELQASVTNLRQQAAEAEDEMKKLQGEYRAYQKLDTPKQTITTDAADPATDHPATDPATTVKAKEQK